MQGANERTILPLLYHKKCCMRDQIMHGPSEEAFNVPIAARINELLNGARRWLVIRADLNSHTNFLVD